MERKIIISEDMARNISERVIRNKYTRPFNKYTELKTFQEIEHLIMMLTGKEIYPSLIEKLVERLVDRYINSRIPRGQSVGIVASQAFSQPLTQIILKAQHFAGKHSGAKPDALLTSLLTLSSSDNYIILHHSDYSLSEDEVERWAQKFERIFINDVLIDVLENIKYKPIISSKDEDHSFYEDFYNIFPSEPQDSKDYHLRFQVDNNKLFAKRISYIDVINAFKTIENIEIVFSHPSLAIIDVYSTSESDRLSWVSIIEKVSHTLIVGYETIKGYQIKTLTLRSLLTYAEYIESKIRIWYDSSKLMYYPVKRLRKILKKMGNNITENNVLCYFEVGEVKDEFRNITDLLKAIQSLETSPYSYVKLFGDLPDDYYLSEESIIRTDINHQMTLYSNHKRMTFMFGIETTRVLQETSYYELLSMFGHPAANVHYQIMASYQLTGFEKPLRPSTIEKMRKGIIEKTTYENYQKHVQREPSMANIYRLGPYSSVVFGQKIETGTGFFQCIRDEEGLERTKKAYEVMLREKLEEGVSRDHLRALEAIAGMLRVQNSGLCSSSEIPGENRIDIEQRPKLEFLPD